MEDNVLPIIWINNKKYCLHNRLHIYSGGKKLFAPRLILYIWPLTKYLSVYNFNGRFIWTVRYRIKKKYK